MVFCLLCYFLLSTNSTYHKRVRIQLQNTQSEIKQIWGGKNHLIYQMWHNSFLMAKFLRLMALIRHTLHYHHWRGAITKLVQRKEANACAKVDSPQPWTMLGKAWEGRRLVAASQNKSFSPKSYSNVIFFCYHKRKRLGSLLTIERTEKEQAFFRMPLYFRKKGT